MPSRRTALRRSRTGLLERFELDGRTCFRKLYCYPPPLGPLRGLCRNTFLARSRVAREARALERLAELGVQPALLVGAAEQRVLGFLLRAELWTWGFGDLDLERRLAEGPLSRSELGSLAAFVRALHEAGLRDPDLYARNLLLARAGPGWAKIDASASRLVAPGARFDRARRQDLAGLLDDLARLGVPAPQRARLLVRQWFPGPRPAGFRRAAPARARA